MVKSVLTKNQKQTFSKEIRYNKHKCRIYVTLRYDDECGNGHNTFSITGSIKDLENHSYNSTVCAGCIHDEIAKYFPEFKHLIKWHLCSSDEPMRYIANTLYWASDSASTKYKAGEPNSWERVLKFKDSFITHKFDKNFIEFLETHKGRPFEVVEIPHKKDSSYNYDPKYTFNGFECEWWQCPFNTKEKAMEYKNELKNKKWEIKTIVTGYQQVKERDFKNARASAIWEDATDEQLSLPSEELKKLLLKRLLKKYLIV